ncbi:MAG TPA: ribulokinase [Candidatus Humimicrobiaceae bacterium]
MSQDKYVIGLDFGTDSVRAVIVNAANGSEEATSVSNYKRWSEGKYSDASKNQFRHHPLDYIESMQEVIEDALKLMPAKTKENIIAIGVDTTGSTPAPIDKDGNVLALNKDFTDNPNAMFILWKDHTALKEAELINKAAKSSKDNIDYTKYEGGVYSSEWFWAKMLHTIKIDSKVRDAAYSWIELCDWIPSILTGSTKPQNIKRSRCAAGHKAMWHKDWNGLPPNDFLSFIDPLLDGMRERLYEKTYTSDISAGNLSKEWANKFGIGENVSVTVGAFDVHMGAVGANIKESVFVKVLGTSCCDVAVGKKQKNEKLIAGICGQVDGSIIPGMIGYEAGQSSFGDVYAWFRSILSWPLNNILVDTDIVSKDTAEKLIKETEDKILREIENSAEKINTKDSSIISLDWLNGRRTPYADQKLKGAIIGLTLGSDAVKMYKSLVEATAFGSKAIIDRFTEDGLEIKEVVAIGGISQKSSLVMQVLSDVLDMPVKVLKSTQAVALGAAIFGAVTAGYYKDIMEAQKYMASKFLKEYNPIPENVKIYKDLYRKYIKAGKSLETLLQNI